MSNENFVDLIQNLNNNLTYYFIEPAERAIGEEGKYVESTAGVIGYQLVNKVTGVIEHTSIMLPGIIFQAQHFDDMLKSLLSKKDTPQPGEVTSEDVVIN